MAVEHADSQSFEDKVDVWEPEVLEETIRTIISVIGDNPMREGLAETPARVVSSWAKLFWGYKIDPKEFLRKTFDAGGYNEMVMLKHIEFY